MDSSWFHVPLINSTRDLLHQIAIYVGDYWGNQGFSLEPKGAAPNCADASSPLSDFQATRVRCASELIEPAALLCEQIFSTSTKILPVERCATKEAQEFITLIRLSSKICESAKDLLDIDD